jgi:hypothetical protein
MKPTLLFIPFFFILCFAFLSGAYHDRNRLLIAENIVFQEKPAENHEAMQSLILKGNIGPDGIEMEIITWNSEESIFTGRYAYDNRKTYFDIQGKIYGHCLLIEEFFNGEHTGTFYLEINNDVVHGKLIHGSKFHDVHLTVYQGDIHVLKPPDYQTLSEKVSNKRNGTYSVGDYFINDAFFSEENPYLEIGFNGGDLVIKEDGKNNFQFELTLIIGPSAHIAHAKGIAQKRGKVYVYENDDGCRIEFRFSEKTVHAVAQNGMDCGFGARAYVDHHFIKISEEL